MKNLKILIIISIISVIFLIGCENKFYDYKDSQYLGKDKQFEESPQKSPETSGINQDEINQEAEEDKVTEEFVEDLIEQGKKEAKSQLNCVDECVSYKCDNSVYYLCNKGPDGCNHFSAGIIKKGYCNVQCTKNLDCTKPDICMNYACAPPPSCGDGICDSSEDCFSCSSDCGSCQSDLSGFPGIFFSGQLTAITGKQAPASDTLALINVLNAVESACNSNPSCAAMYPTGMNPSTILDDEFNGFSGSTIIVGSIINGICQNSLLDNHINCANSGLSPGQGIIILKKEGNNLILIVAGDVNGIQQASKVLQNYKNYKLSGSQYVS